MKNFNTTAAFIGCLFFCLSSQAELIESKFKTIDVKSFSLKHACSYILKKDYPLVQKKNELIIDCMGKDISASDFCAKASAKDPYLVKGIVTSTQVQCLSSKLVNLKYRCDTNECLNTKELCLKLKKVHAVYLELKNYKLIKEKRHSIVTCSYGVPRIDSL